MISPNYPICPPISIYQSIYQKEKGLQLIVCNPLISLVEMKGLEPSTSGMRGQRSPN